VNPSTIAEPLFLYELPACQEGSDQFPIFDNRMVREGRSQKAELT